MQSNIAINPTDFVKAMMMPVHERRWILQQIGKSAMSQKQANSESDISDSTPLMSEANEV